MSETVVVVNATSGVVRYDWALGDSDSPASSQAEFEVTFSDGRKQTAPTLTYITVDVLADLDGA